jgi:hypothetical protein
VAGLQVGATVIPIAPDGFDRDVDDNVDRARADDGTMRVTVLGSSKRSWPFRTPPITRASADTIDAVLATVGVQSCQGDVLGAVINCFTRRTGWKGITIKSAHMVVLSFVLDEA